MYCEVEKIGLSNALKQILLGQKAGSQDAVDLTLGTGKLVFVITGRSVELEASVSEIGSASVPSSVLQRVKDMLNTYKESSIRLRVSAGKLRIQGCSISDPRIANRLVSGRIIHLPIDPLDNDLLALLLFTPEEISESALASRVLEAQSRLTSSLEAASHLLASAGITLHELRELAERKVASHANLLGRMLLEHEADG